MMINFPKEISDKISILDQNTKDILCSQGVNESLIVDCENLDNLNVKLLENAKLTLIVVNATKKIIDAQIKFFQQKNSQLNLLNISLSSSDVTINEEINLLDLNATCIVKNVFLTKLNEKLNSNIYINHLQSKTNSELSTYSIALNHSEQHLNQNAKIVRGASKSKVFQKAKGLTIGQESKISALPNLFIDEYDVIANHAATIGSISKDDLFYLMSRGLSKEEASKIVVLGFINPLLDSINNLDLVSFLKQMFVNKLRSENNA